MKTYLITFGLCLAAVVVAEMWLIPAINNSNN